MAPRSEHNSEHSPVEPKFILGVPNQDAPPNDPLAAVPVKASPAGQRHTVEQWQSLGVPGQTPMEFEPATTAESRQVRPVEANIGADDASEPQIEADFWRGLVGNRSVIAVLVLLVCMILLVVGAQLLTLVTQLSMLTGGLRLIGFLVTGILLALSLWAIVRLASLYFRLKSNKPVSLHDLAALRQRAQLRSEGLRQLRDVRRQLAVLLEVYPLTEKPAKSPLLKLGATTQQIEGLSQGRRWLLAERAGESNSWIKNFNRMFLHHLDQIADQRMRVYAKRLLLQTGAAHQRTIDTIIVLMNAYLLVGDLCAIYNLRASKWGTAKILSHVFVNTFAASQVDQWSDVAADHAVKWVSQLLPHTTNAAGQLAEGAGVGIVSKVLPRVGAGMANGVLLYRLGKTTVRELRPVQE